MYNSLNLAAGTHTLRVKFTGDEVQYFDSNKWADKYQYGFYLISTIPTLLSLLSLFIASLGLIVFRSWIWVKIIRIVLASYLLSVIIATVVDYYYFDFGKNINRDIFSLIFPSLYLPYFFVSKRVKHVFKTHDWQPKMAELMEVPQKNKKTRY